MSTTLTDRAVDEKEAAQILGLSPITLRKMRSLGPQSAGLPEIPYMKYSARCVRYSVVDLADWKARHRVQPVSAA